MCAYTLVPYTTMMALCSLVQAYTVFLGVSLDTVCLGVSLGNTVGVQVLILVASLDWPVDLEASSLSSRRSMPRITA